MSIIAGASTLEGSCIGDVVPCLITTGICGQALAMAIEAEALYEGSWVYCGKDGEELGPFARSELLRRYNR